MEIIKINNFSFTYPGAETPSLCDINLEIKKGDFFTLCGKSGCGKSTLLRCLKPIISPYGRKNGEIFFENTPIEKMSERTQSEKIGFVTQSPENQTVTDKVWHEMAFGLENLGIASEDIRVKVAETASFFGIQTWFHKNVCELSGGQKQLLNLASVMVMQPEVIVLDEPTSQLDPIAAGEFLNILRKINKELGTTVIISEHRLEDVFSVSDRVAVMDCGKVVTCGEPSEVGKFLSQTHHDMFSALPAAIKVYESVPSNFKCPITAADGRKWLLKIASEKPLFEVKAKDREAIHAPTALELKDIWFKYEQNTPYIIKGLSLKVQSGEFYALLGGNGTGKTTVLSLIGENYNVTRGKIKLFDKKLRPHGILGILPQNPQTLFVKKTVRLDLEEMVGGFKKDKTSACEKIDEVMQLCQIDRLADRHPYDLSGGEQQRAALAKVLLLNPKILLLDEPTKGLDASFKEVFASIINKLKQNGVAVLMVSHDIEFCAKYADRCGLMFDGAIVSENTPRAFFAEKSFYTTAANRMSRGIIKNAITAEDIIFACNGKTGGNINENK